MRHSLRRSVGSIALVLGLLGANAPAADTLPPAVATQLDACNVSWDTPGPTSAESMPIGNGDIGLNVWVEPNGDLDFYIGKTDSWSERNLSSEGLLKLGQVRVSLSPSPMAPGRPFLQVLKLRTSEMEIRYGSEASYRIWVDANNPVIHVEEQGAQPAAMTVHLIDWRTTRYHDISPDTILSGLANRIAWYHRNSAASDPHLDPHLQNLTSGAVIKGDHLVRQDDTTLVSAQPATSRTLSIYPLTATTTTPDAWLDQLNKQIAQVDAIPLEEAFARHQQWWEQFWARSWIFVRGDAQAAAVTEGYVLQRFITACGGRGKYPIKFNGSIFVVDNPVFPENHQPHPVDADVRAWGGQYWFQNTRLMYWPRLAAGDFDLMMPLFNMYGAQLAPNATQVEAYYKHGGSYLAETAPFWGGLQYAGPEVPGKATLHYFTPILELSMMMLDYYDYTGDTDFARQRLLPMALAGIQFFTEHFGRDKDGKLLLDPDNAIETYHKAHDPAPDIAGLTAITQRLLALPDSLVDAKTRETLLAFQKLVPPLPIGQRGDQTVLLPYTFPPFTTRVGPENPELYAVFPFRLYGLDKPGFQMAVATFNARQSPGRGGWNQDPMHAAMVGMTDVVKDRVVFNFTNKEPRLKFPAFWTSMQDYTPNQCNGGNGEDGLQKMLLQTNGHTLLLLPAWPKGWDADFKLHAPGPTTLQGSVRNGHIVDLVVTPPSHASWIVDMSGLSETAPTGDCVTSTDDDIVPVKETVMGGPNVVALAADTASGDAHSPGSGQAGTLNAMYFDKAATGTKSGGVDTGLVITPRIGPTVATAFQIASAGGDPARDPLTITIEGSHAANAREAGARDFTLLYQGQCGLLSHADRKSWGLYVNFPNTTAYASYRVLVTAKVGSGSDAVQYSGIRLFGIATNPLPGTNLASPADPIAAVKATTPGGPNVFADAGTDYSSHESAASLTDGNLDTKYYNTGDKDTGFVITPSAGPKAINGFQFATANDSPDRDPVTVVIEGSNAADAGANGGNGFVTLWQGSSGLVDDPGRKAWGKRVSFWNASAYKTYRILITGTRNDSHSPQYAEVHLFAP